MSRAEADELWVLELLELPLELYDEADEDCALCSRSMSCCSRSLAELVPLLEELLVLSVDDVPSEGGGPGGGPPCAPPGPLAKVLSKTPFSSVA